MNKPALTATRGLLMALVASTTACNDPGKANDPAKFTSLADVPDSIERVDAPATGVSLGWG